MNWKYTDASRHAVYRILANGNVESCLIAAIPAPAGTIDAEDPPPPPTQDELDATAAKAYAKLVALRAMTPAQVQTWVTANVTNLAQAQDAIMTLAIAVSILARRL
jgi:hypothetical protein